MMNNIGGDEDLPDLDGADDVRVICLLQLKALSIYLLTKTLYPAEAVI